MLDVEIVTKERRLFFVETRGGVYFPIAGAMLLAVAGIAEFCLSRWA